MRLERLAFPVQKGRASVELTAPRARAKRPAIRPSRYGPTARSLASGPMSGGRGGIGRHARFRFSCRKAWGFESLRPHQTEMEVDNASDGTVGRGAEAA